MNSRNPSSNVARSLNQELARATHSSGSESKKGRFNLRSPTPPPPGEESVKLLSNDVPKFEPQLSVPSPLTSCDASQDHKQLLLKVEEKLTSDLDSNAIIQPIVNQLIDLTFTYMSRGQSAVEPYLEKEIKGETLTGMMVDGEETEPRSKSDQEAFDALIVKQKVEEMVETICQQSGQNTIPQDTVEAMDESSANDIDPVKKPEAESKPSLEQNSIEVEDFEACARLVKSIQNKARALLDDWECLKEMFKIPKKELNKLRAKHEEEADQAAAKYQPSTQVKASPSSVNSRTSAGVAFPRDPRSKPTPSFSSYERPHRIQAVRPESPTRREQSRISRFDDQSGLLHLHSSEYNLSREHRRQLFRLRAETETREKERRVLLQKQHENKCYYLRLNAALTPMFPQYPEYFLDHTGQWAAMPPPYPEVEVTWGYATMAHLPLEAFSDRDPPLPNPSYYYPPGVVEVSYLYGMPPEEEPVEVAPPILPEEPQEPFIDLRKIELPPENPPPPPPPVPRISMMEEDEDESSSSGSSTSSIHRHTQQQPPMPSDPIPFLSSESSDQIPFLSNDRNIPLTTELEFTQENSSDLTHPEPSMQTDSQRASSTVVPSFSTIPTSTNSNGYLSASIVIRLPPKWKTAKSAEGRTYYYNCQTKETRWDPPIVAGEDEGVEEVDSLMMDLETASTDSDEPMEPKEEDGDTDDEDDDDDDEEEGSLKQDNQTELEIIASDLSAQEKELLLTKKKSREERRHERRQKRERDREKREYERKRRRERHGRHRKAGLVQEHLIPVRERARNTSKNKRSKSQCCLQKRTEKDKVDLMTFTEIKERLANRDAIREAQEVEERAEADRDRELERAKRLAEVSAKLKEKTTTAAADTSSEVAKKFKERFTSEVSRVIVKVLTSFRQDGTKKGAIKNKDDFKHLAKKVRTWKIGFYPLNCYL